MPSAVSGGGAGGGSVSLGYLVYVALLTQAGEDAPVATVLQNTLDGAVVWTRAAFGQYQATLAGAFTAGKTAVFFGPPNINNPIGNDAGVIYEWQRSSDSVITINTKNLLPVIASAGRDDALLDNTPIEIRVYPAD